MASQFHQGFQDFTPDNMTKQPNILKSSRGLLRSFPVKNIEETNSTIIEKRTSFRSVSVSSLESLRSSKLVHLQFVSSLKHQINLSLVMSPGGIPMAFSHKNPSMSDFIRTALTGTAAVTAVLSLESF